MSADRVQKLSYVELGMILYYCICNGMYIMLLGAV